MITYSFEPRFVPLIRSGVMSMVFTLPPPRRLPATGETISLVERATGNLIAHATCVGVAPMEIVWSDNGRITTIRESDMPLLRPEACARRMGYADLIDMAQHLSHLALLGFWVGRVTEWVIPELALAEVEAA